MAERRTLDPRRVPTQERSRERVERILDAAAQVMAKVGYQAATTDAIAAQAGTSVGSLYQFFPNKTAVFRALTLRYLEQFRQAFVALVTPEVLQRPVEEMVTLVFDTFTALHAQNPGLRNLFIGSLGEPELFAATEELHREFERGVEALLMLRAKHLPPKKRAVIAAVAVQVVSMLLWLARRDDDDFKQAVIDEAKSLVSGYLRPYLEEPPKKKTSRKG